MLWFKKYNKWANKLVHKLDWFDIKLIGLACISLGIFLAYTFSIFAHVNLGLYVLLFIACYIRVIYVIFRK